MTHHTPSVELDQAPSVKGCRLVTWFAAVLGGLSVSAAAFDLAWLAVILLCAAAVVYASRHRGQAIEEVRR